jgi:hypothetical protein
MATLTTAPPAVTEPATRARRRWWDREWAAAFVAAVLAMAAFCLSLAATHTYPFGTHSRAVNDLGNQFIPFHAELWDLEHGVMNGDLFLSWNSGYGAAFLPDVFTYLGSPFSWLVGLWPRDLLDFPVFLVTLFGLGCAAAAMTVFLGRLQPGSRWWRVLLGVGYGMCGWVVNDAFADPMWFGGLVGLPLICIAADWCLQGRRWVAGTLLVTLVWVTDFYTAAMATIAAALILLVRLLLDDRPWAARLRVLARAGSMALTGVLIAAPVLTVSWLASRNAQQLEPGSYPGPPSLADLGAQFLPGGKSLVAVPNLAIGLLGLLLVAAYPFNRRAPVPERWVWPGLLVVVMLSFFWTPTLLFWHGLAYPNGSPYRAAFVFSGMLTMVAWLSFARRPRFTALLAGAAVILALTVLTRHTSAVRVSVWISVLSGLPLALGALVLLTRDSRVLRGIAGVVLALGVVAGSAYTAAVADDVRLGQAFFDPHPTLQQPAVRRAFDAVQRARSWPAARVETGPHGFANNDPALLRTEGSRYYDTYVAAVTSAALGNLGIDWTWGGRHLHSPTDPVTRALMGVSTYLEPPGPTPDFTVVPAGPAAPLVTVHPAGTPPVSSVFARQEALLGATVYQVPALRAAKGAVPGQVPGGAWASFTGTCAPGSEIYFYAPWFSGWVAGAHSGAYRFDAVEYRTRNPLQLLGTTPADGKVWLAAKGRWAQFLPSPAVGCLDRAKLAAAVARLRAGGATRVETGGHTLAATLPAGSSGTAVVAVPAIPGWSCSDGGAMRPPTSFYGFIGVPLTGGSTRIRCSFEPPGLRPGLVGSGAGLVILLAVAVVRRRAVRG